MKLRPSDRSKSLTCARRVVLGRVTEAAVSHRPIILHATPLVKLGLHCTIAAKLSHGQKLQHHNRQSHLLSCTSCFILKSSLLQIVVIFLSGYQVYWDVRALSSREDQHAGKGNMQFDVFFCYY